MHKTALSTSRKDKCEDYLGFHSKTMDETKLCRKLERQRDTGQGENLFPASSAALGRAVNESVLLRDMVVSQPLWHVVLTIM